MNIVLDNAVDEKAKTDIGMVVSFHISPTCDLSVQLIVVTNHLLFIETRFPQTLSLPSAHGLVCKCVLCMAFHGLLMRRAV